MRRDCPAVPAVRSLGAGGGSLTISTEMHKSIKMRYGGYEETKEKR